jgi:hypothetical protein
MGRKLRGRDGGGSVNNVQYKTNQNCHYKPPPYNEYILIKNIIIKNPVPPKKKKSLISKERERERERETNKQTKTTSNLMLFSCSSL